MAYHKSLSYINGEGVVRNVILKEQYYGGTFSI